MGPFVFTADWLTEMWQHIPVLAIRTMLTFVLVLTVVRWTGKRSIANLAPFDLAMVILIGEVAAIPVADLRVDLLHGLLPVLMVGALHVLMTKLNMHWEGFERWTEGTPTLLMKDGKVLKKNLIKERVSVSDLETTLRHKEIMDPCQVAEAWIEHAGGISVLRKPEEDAVTPKQLDAALELAIERIAVQSAARVRVEVETLLRDHLAQWGDEPCAPYSSSSTEWGSEPMTPP